VRYLGVITGAGKPSTSPVFQQAAIDALALDLKYEQWPTEPSGLATRVTGLRAPTVLGANVTIPHKEAIVPLLDELDPVASRVGAVNTVHNRDGLLAGYNTDVAGFLRALRDDAGFDPAGCSAVIAGAGGAARAVIVALAGVGAGSVVIVNRTIERAERLAVEFSGASELAVRACADTLEEWSHVTSGADLLINCTALGSEGDLSTVTPVPAEVIRPGMLVYDLVYRPLETRLLREAAGRGARTLGGLPMLIYQGAASLKIWTGRDAPADVMFTAARAALAESGRR
jgi:shikimate dehydrogenase